MGHKVIVPYQLGQLSNCDVTDLFISRPCILIFDSLATGSRSRVVATLRDYLQCEYDSKVKGDRKFDKDTIKGCSPRVPQQPNFSDCGIFVLQYCESFFKVTLTVQRHTLVQG